MLVIGAALITRAGMKARRSGVGSLISGSLLGLQVPRAWVHRPFGRLGAAEGIQAASAHLRHRSPDAKSKTRLSRGRAECGDYRALRDLNGIRTFSCPGEGGEGAYLFGSDFNSNCSSGMRTSTGSFCDARHERRVGEASGWYLYSTAAGEIKPSIPATISSCARPSNTHALHAQLRIQRLRRRGRCCRRAGAEGAGSAACGCHASPIREASCIEGGEILEQVKKVFRRFDPAKNKSIIYDDLSATRHKLSRDLIFPGVDPMQRAVTFSPDKRVRSKASVLYPKPQR